jgi:hypothetical protein
MHLWGFVNLSTCDILQVGGKFQYVPLILQVGAIWIALLRPKGKVRRDGKGQRRAFKASFGSPALTAVGIWPDTDHAKIFLWHLGQSEDARQ